MIAEWAQRYVSWFGFGANVAWFVAFWLFVAFLLSLEMLVPAFKKQPDRSDRWPTNFGLGILSAGLAAITPVSTVSAAEWASRMGVGLLNEIVIPLWASICATFVVYSLTIYLCHVIEHKTAWLWRLHRVHHL